MNDNLNFDPALKIEARAWVVRLQSRDVAPELQAELDDWCNQSPAHKATYLHELADLKSTGMLKSSERYGAENTAWMLSPTSHYWLKVGAVAAGVLILFSVVVAGGRPHMPDGGERMTSGLTFQPYATKRGEIKIYRLSDGSVATLDTNSKIQVSMTRERRYLRLAQGRARFQVASDPRPFVVKAGAAEVVTKTGSFDLMYASNERVTVQLIEGDAYLRPTTEFASYNFKTHSLTAGMPFSYHAANLAQAKSDDDDSKFTNRDWTSGWVEYKSIRLDVLVAQANAYAAKPIKLDDPAIGDLNISGRFRISDTNSFVDRICELFDLRAIVREDGIHLRKL